MLQTPPNHLQTATNIFILLTHGCMGPPLPHPSCPALAGPCSQTMAERLSSGDVYSLDRQGFTKFEEDLMLIARK